MREHDGEQRLSQIATRWSLVLEAHQGRPGEVASAQQQLLQRYGGAVYRYLLAALRDPDAADEVAQEFALRFLRGDFRRADPQRGRFRNFVKTALLNLIIDHHRRLKARPVPLPDGYEPLAALCQQPEEFDRQFADYWRGELLERAWQTLAQLEQETGQPLHTVLRFRADYPELRSAQLSEELSDRLGKTVTAGWVRQVLYRARKFFVAFLVEEVWRSLPGSSWAEVEEELVDLGLWEYCRPTVEEQDSCC